MIDIVFQLIAFFMVLVNFTKIDADNRVDLPVSSIAKPPGKSDKQPLMLQMTEDGQVILAGDTMAVESQEFDSRLFRESRRLGAIWGEAANVPVVVRGHMNAKTGDIQELITKCQSKSFQLFRLRAKIK